MERMFTDTGFEVTKLVGNGRTIFTKKKSEAVKLTEKVGYFYPVFDVKKCQIGYGIPK